MSGRENQKFPFENKNGYQEIKKTSMSNVHKFFEESLFPVFVIYGKANGQETCVHFGAGAS